MNGKQLNELLRKRKSAGQRGGLNSRSAGRQKQTRGMKQNWLLYASILAPLLSSCASQPQVAASCPPFPEPPKVVQQQTLPALKQPSLSQEFSTQWQVFLDELQDSFKKAMRPVPTLPPAAPGS